MTTDELYKIAVTTRQFEIQMLWQRSNYFMVLNTAVAIGFFSQKDAPYAATLAFLGAAVCMAWCFINFGSKYWQSRWEEAASRLETQCAAEAKLFAATSEEVHGEVTRSLAKAKPQRIPRKCLDRQILKKPSVSYHMTLLSFLFVLFWAIAFCVSVLAMKREPPNKAPQPPPVPGRVAETS